MKKTVVFLFLIAAILVPHSKADSIYVTGFTMELPAVIPGGFCCSGYSLNHWSLTNDTSKWVWFDNYGFSGTGDLDLQIDFTVPSMWLAPHSTFSLGGAYAWLYNLFGDVVVPDGFYYQGEVFVSFEIADAPCPDPYRNCAGGTWSGAQADYVLFRPPAVPEPSSLILFVSGAIGFVGALRLRILK